MDKRIIAMAVTAAMLGYTSSGIAAESEKQSKQAESSAAGAGPEGAMGAPGAGSQSFKWPAMQGQVEVVKGEIEEWTDQGKLQTGGILGLGGAKLSVTNDTVIVDDQGKRLSRKDLKKGAQVATIYKEAEKGDQNAALVIVVEKAAKGGGQKGGAEQSNGE